MSWLTGRAATMPELVALRPGLVDDWAALEAPLWELERPSPVTLELCRLRIAQLVGAEAELARRTPAAVAAGLDEDRVAHLPSWTADPAATPEERAALAVAEQVLIDPHGLDDATFETARDVLGDDGLIAVAVAVAIFEGAARAAAILGAAPAPAGGGRR